MINIYSQEWIDKFLLTRDIDLTNIEVQFLISQLGARKSVIDLGCGDGRHTEGLLKNNYSVIALDNNTNILDLLNRRLSSYLEQNNKKLQLLNLDFLNLKDLTIKVDGVISMWQSIGYFDSNTNYSIFQNIVDLLNENGLFILDIYNRDYFENHFGMREININNEKIIEETKFEDNRYYVKLKYTNSEDNFSWELYNVQNLKKIMESMGMRFIDTFVWFKKSEVKSTDSRFQIIFSK